MRFDLEKGADDIKFTFTSFEDEEEIDEDEEEKNEENSDSESVDSRARKIGDEYAIGKSAETSPRIGPIAGKRAANAWLMDLDSMVREYDDCGTRMDKNSSGEPEEETSCDPKEEEKSGAGEGEEKSVEAANLDGDEEKNREEFASKSMKIIGRRFVVENVSEKEHMSQLSRQDSTDVERDFLPKNKFSNIRNIDIFSKSESESKSSLHDETKSSVLEDIRRNKEIMLENMKRTDKRAKKDKQREREQVYQMMKLRQDLEPLCSQEGQRGRTTSRSNLEEIKVALSKQHDRQLLQHRRELENSLDRSKSQMEENLAMERARLAAEMEKRIESLRQELSRKEKQEIESLIAEMDQLRSENLKKVRNELEICYEKERQDILENLKIELDERKKELLELRNEEMEKLLNEHEKNMAEEKTLKLAEMEITKQQNEKIEEMKKVLEKEFDDLKNDLRTRQREKIIKITEDHEKCLAEILRDFRMDVSLSCFIFHVVGSNINR